MSLLSFGPWGGNNKYPISCGLYLQQEKDPNQKDLNGNTCSVSRHTQQALWLASVTQAMG